MEESRLETKSQESIFKKIQNFTTKLFAYITDGVLIDKKISVNNHVVYSHINPDRKNYMESKWNFNIPSQYK